MSHCGFAASANLRTTSSPANEPGFFTSPAFALGFFISGEMDMPEPSSGAVVGTAVVGLGTASLLPGVDLNAVIGAFAGALFFVLYARDLTTKARVGYLLVSWVGGYYVAAEAVGRALTEYSGLPALVAGACIVTALIGVLEWMVGGKAPTWLRTVFGFFTGGRKDGS